VKPLERCQDAAIDLHYIIRNFASFHTNLADLTADGYPRTASGGEKAPGGAKTTFRDPDSGETVSVDLTATEAAMVARQRYAAIWNQVEAFAIELHADIRGLRNLITPYVLNELPRLGDRCTGGYGLEGSTTWGEPTCTRNAVTRDGLCDPCRQRQGRWERNRGVA
jgi:hypothetical protein